MRKPTAAELLVIAHTKKAHSMHDQFQKASLGSDGIIKEYGYPPKGLKKNNSSSQAQGMGGNN